MTADADEHGFDAHGYLQHDTPPRLAAAFAGWLGAYASEASDQAPTALLVVQQPDGTEVGTVPLTGRLVNELVNMLHHRVHDQQEGEKTVARRKEMTALIVKARRAGWDVGNLVAYSLAAAAGKLYLGRARLVHGRPGSWEAAIVMDWADFGGVLPAGDDARVLAERLAELFHLMGDAKDDGGQVVADALGYAAQELGGLEALAGGSYWAHNVWNMAKALNYEDEWEPQS